MLTGVKNITLERVWVQITFLTFFLLMTILLLQLLWETGFNNKYMIGPYNTKKCNERN